MGLAATDEFVDVGHLRPQPVTSQVLKPLMLRGRVGQPFGDHRVEPDGRDCQTVLFQDHRIELGMMGHFGNGRIGHGRANRLQHTADGQLPGYQFGRAGEQVHLA